MHPIFADVRQDLAAAAAESSLLDQARMRCERVVQTSTDPVDLWIYVNAVASGIEKVYSGIERALTRIARGIDGHVPDGPGWHADLLRRLSVELAGRRPALLAMDSRKRLDELRAFRHRERNSYVRELEARRVLEVAADVLPALRALDSDLERFQRHFDDSSPPPPRPSA